MLTDNQIEELARTLEALRFYPGNPQTREIIIATLSSRIKPEHFGALQNLILERFSEWPSVASILTVYREICPLPSANYDAETVYGPPPVFVCRSCGDTGVLMGKSHGGLGLCHCPAAQGTHAQECIQRWRNRRHGVNTDAPEVVS